jgi:hypothetical protein
MDHLARHDFSFLRSSVQGRGTQSKSLQMLSREVMTALPSLASSSSYMLDLAVYKTRSNLALSPTAIMTCPSSHSCVLIWG